MVGFTVLAITMY